MKNRKELTPETQILQLILQILSLSVPAGVSCYLDIHKQCQEVLMVSVQVFDNQFRISSNWKQTSCSSSSGFWYLVLCDLICLISPGESVIWPLSLIRVSSSSYSPSCQRVMSKWREKSQHAVCSPISFHWSNTDSKLAPGSTRTWSTVGQTSMLLHLDFDGSVLTYYWW